MSMLDKQEILEKVSRAVKAVRPKGDGNAQKVTIKESHSFGTDLDFDSLRIATLSIALEEEFTQVLLLNEWIGSADDPELLTVGSLVDYLAALFAQEEAEYAV